MEPFPIFFGSGLMGLLAGGIVGIAAGQVWGILAGAIVFGFFVYLFMAHDT